MKEKSNFAVSLAHYLCPVCMTKEEVIIMPSQFTPKAVKSVEEANGKAIGFGDLCDSCKSHHDNGFKALIEIDPDKSEIDGTNVGLENVWRTGKVVWLKNDKVEEIFGELRPQPLVLVELGVFDKLGLTKILEEHESEEQSETSETQKRD